LGKRYFKILLDCGHVGNGNSIEVARYVTAKDCVDALTLGNRMPRVKRKHERTGTIRVTEISYSDYCAGKKSESVHSYRHTYKPLKCG